MIRIIVASFLSRLLVNVLSRERNGAGVVGSDVCWEGALEVLLPVKVRRACYCAAMSDLLPILVMPECMHTQCDYDEAQELEWVDL
jgi:hypothetical protein